MATQQIPDLDPATALTGSEEFPARQGADDKRVTVDQVQARFDPFFESANPKLLKADTAATLTAGFSMTPHDAGTKVSGTYTPDIDLGNLQYVVNGGAHTLAPPSNSGNLVIEYTNNSSAGDIDTSGFSKVDGDFSKDSNYGFMAHITKISAFTYLEIVSMQTIRLIPQFNGVDNYATLDTPAVLGAGDTIEIVFSNVFESAANKILNDSDTSADRPYILSNTANNLSWNTGVISGVTLDGSPAVNASTPFPNDGGEHTVIATMSTAARLGVIGAAYTFGSMFKGHILSFKTTISSVETEYVLDTKTPAGITYTNFDPVVDWHTYEGSKSIGWAYQGSGTVGSQLMQFEGTATTPLSSSITVTGSTWEMNWEGLWVAHYVSGAGAYTYLAAPDGVPMRCNIEVMDDVTAYSMINEKTTVQSVDNALAAFAESITRVPRVCDVTLTGNSIPTSAGLANKAIIEAEGGTVLVDS